MTDRKSTRLNSSHLVISYAVFCLKKKTSHGLTPDRHPVSVWALRQQSSPCVRACGEPGYAATALWSETASVCVHDCFFFNDTATTEIYTLSLHDALPI